MAVQVSYPGVYIEEFAPGAPIEGVGTSTAAFLGPAKNGSLNTPTKITSWDAFLAGFGEEPLDGTYLWYAVRGFFENNGKVCYVVRASNAKYDSLTLNDRAGAPLPTIVVQARNPGDNTANQITVAIADAHAQTTKVFRPTAVIANASASTIKVTDPAAAAKFMPGNKIFLKQAAKTDTAVVARIENDLIRLSGSLTKTYTGGDVRLDDLVLGVTDTFRVENGDKLAAGSVLLLTQNPGPKKDTVVVKSVSVERISPALTTYQIVLKKALAKSFAMDGNDIAVELQEFKLTAVQGAIPKDYDLLSMEADHPNYFVTAINGDLTSLITALPVEPPNTTAPPDNRPAVLAATALTGGANDNYQTLTPNDYKAALRTLEAIDDVNMIAVPDATDADVQLAMIAHCERLQDRFAILDARRGLAMFGAGSIETQRAGVASTYGYAALYYPWLLVSPAKGTLPVLVPPSGHVAGIYARIDNSRGVFKAPAGLDSMVNGALGVETSMSDIDQGLLNLQGINVIRVFQGGGRPTVWGARTTASDKNWQYVNIRRLFLFLEESIQEGILWAVFEPNNLALWEKLKRTIRAFLLQQWRDGALFGAKPEDAFYVRIDEVLNPFAEQAKGRLHIEIGLRPSYPAEFIIVRIGIWQGGSEVSES